MPNPTMEQVRNAWLSALPDPEHRRMVASIMAETISRAHAVSPSCWMVSYMPHRAKLNINVGRAFTIAVREGDLSIILDTSNLPDGVILDSWHGGRPERRFKVVPEATWVSGPPAEILACWEQLRESYFSAIDKAIGTSSGSPWWRSHSEGALQLLRDESGQVLAAPLPPVKVATAEVDLWLMLDEFAADYPDTQRGREHTQQYIESQATFRLSFAGLKSRRAAGEDITDYVLLQLLPHSHNADNLERGAWVTPAPVLKTDIRTVFEKTDRAKPEHWPTIARLIMEFFESCESNPENLDTACRAFAAQSPAKGFQSALLSAGLAALNPDAFGVINKKSRLAVERLSAIKHTANLLEYPATNADLMELVESARNVLSQCEALKDLHPTFRFDMFTHWLSTVRPDNATVKYWKIAPGEQAFNWDECRRSGFISMGWEKFGDLTDLSREEFDVLMAERAADDGKGYSDGGTPQLWTFANDIQPGDRIIANKGLTRILGVGTVTDDYYYVPDVTHGHRLPVAWDDFTPIDVPKQGWHRTIVMLKKKKFEELSSGMAVEPVSPRGTGCWLFQANPDRYDLEHELRVDGAAGVESWLVSTHRDAMKSGDTVLLWQSGKKAGIYGVAELTSSAFEVTAETADDFAPVGGYKVHLRVTRVLEEPIPKDTLRNFPELADMHILKAPLGTNFRVTADEWATIRKLLNPAGPDRGAPPTVEEISSQTGFEPKELRRWLNAINRKGQAVLYGPPGTGKTFVADLLARHLAGTGENDGFVDLVQFHPAYTYEDFIQGLRPVLTASGGLDYRLVPGRFLEFCRRASRHQGTCVLILDEINRANLARVFGELMYLLEYREHKVPLAAGGELSIPANVRVIGTMNTADRSIALVDHALRRRFAFIHLRPQYAVLEKYHQGNGFDADALVKVLKRLNVAIDDPHYELGISYFLREELGDHIEDIWRMEIEPYLEEYFFDQAAKAQEYSWEKLKTELQ